MPNRFDLLSGESGASQSFDAFLGGYKALPGAPDEMVDASGAVRPHWRALVQSLCGIGHAELARRFKSAERHIRDAGIMYRVYDKAVGAERPWPLSCMPLLLDAQEWRLISAGLAQRAGLMELILADIYGKQTLIKKGLAPAAAIAGNPEFLRPMVGVKQRGGRFLHMYAADLGRGPDGKWWVLSDRAQSPSGAGYALENRLALSRALPDVYRQFEVERLASFFQAYRAGLSAASRPSDSDGPARVAMFTPGPLNETYFEHAYLARYLGFPLVEGQDLAVRDDAVFMRTVSGLVRTDVLVRRLDSDFADPLELNAESYIGTPGLAGAVRAGNATIANALGAGIIEGRALLAFLPAIAERLLDQPLILPNVATWWCGQESERETVIGRLDSLAVAPAFTPNGAGPFSLGAVEGARLSPEQRADLIEHMRRRGVDWVGQEVVRLSTTPVWRDGQFTPHPFILRVFVAAAPDGSWSVMPGGFCRVSDDLDLRAVGMQQGGRCADVWVVSDQPVEQTSLLPELDSTVVKRTSGALTSRAAENLFWLGRYLERAEASLRLTRALLDRTAEHDRASMDVASRLGNLLIAWGAAPAGDAPDGLAAEALTRADLHGAAPALAANARRCASVIRERLSPDTWRAVEDFAAMLEAPLPHPIASADMHDRAHAALRILAAFSGFAQENMTRTDGWRFLEIGRRIERGLSASRFTGALGQKGASPQSLSALLELGDSQITFAQRYFLNSARAPVVDLLMLDAGNPRSCAFQAEQLRAQLVAISGWREAKDRLPGLERTMERLCADLRTTEAIDIDAAFLNRVNDALMGASDAIAKRYLMNRQRLARVLKLEA